MKPNLMDIIRRFSHRGQAAQAAADATLDPAHTRCSCKKSVLLPPHPRVHCPKCHASYTARTLHYPAFCAHCGFNLRFWRQRNAIPELELITTKPTRPEGAATK